MVTGPSEVMCDECQTSMVLKQVLGTALELYPMYGVYRVLSRTLKLSETMTMVVLDLTQSVIPVR